MSAYPEQEKQVERRERLVRGPWRTDPRPKTRTECPPCKGDCRECPWQGCRYHLALQVTQCGRLRLRKPEDLEVLEHHCALDVVDANPDGMTLQAVGELLGIGRERVRQIEEGALRRLRRAQLRERYQELAEARVEHRVTLLYRITTGPRPRAALASHLHVARRPRRHREQ